MASHEIMTILHSTTSPNARDNDGDYDFHLDGDDEYEAMSPASTATTTRHLMSEDDDDNDVGNRMSRLSIDCPEDDADEEASDQNNHDEDAAMADDDDEEEERPRRPVWAKEYASETDVRVSSRRETGSCRERWLNRSWELRRCGSGGNSRPAGGSPDGDVECRVLVRPRGRSGRMCMDMEEVKACRDLGLELPCDWTVEVSGGGASTVDTASSGGSSPIANWISSPGDDPREIKARLKVWAQAVALASASRLSS